MAILGIDFGTSNTAAAVLRDGKPHLITVEGTNKVLPTSVFFDYDRKETIYGAQANAALIDGREGRFMRALKSVLGTPLMQEKRQIAYERLTLIEVVARFLAMLRERATRETGETYTTALSGRPVRFHSTDQDRDTRAEADLRAAYLLAGFDDVSFMYEPEAAALASGAMPAGSTGLIVDIGGGTSDFSVFVRDGDDTRIIASQGVRVGGTDFDRAISIAKVMPLLGMGHEIRNQLGNGRHIAPNAIYNDLATWQKIPFLYTAENRRMAAEFAKLGIDPARFQRLETVLEMELGHDIAFAVEDGKITLNNPDTTQAQIDLSTIQRGLTAPMSSAEISDVLADHARQIADCAAETLALAGVTAQDIGQVVFVGGSSLMQVVEGTMQQMFPHATLDWAEAFTAVADGLALATARRDAGLARTCK